MASLSDAPPKSASSSLLELRPGAASLEFGSEHTAVRDFNMNASSSQFPLGEALTSEAYFSQRVVAAGAKLPEPATPDLAVSGSQPAPPTGHYFPAPVINLPLPVHAITGLPPVTLVAAAGYAVEVPPFNGELHESFPQWLEEYETVAAGYGWSCELQLQRIGLYLRGRARDMYRSVISQTRNEYSAVKEALLTAFTSSARNEAARCRLHHLRQEATQSAYDFYRNLRDVAAVAHPTMPAAERDRLTLSLFVNGLHGSIGKVIFYRGCTTLEEALTVAEQCEASPQFLCYPEQPPTSFTDQSQLGGDPVDASTRSIDSRVNALADQVTRLTGLLAQRSQDTVRPTYCERRPHAPLPEKFFLGNRSSHGKDGRPRCWICSRPGHVAINCSESLSVQERRRISNRHADQDHERATVGYVGGQSDSAWVNNTATQTQMRGEPAASYYRTPLTANRDSTGRDPYGSTPYERPHVYSVSMTTANSLRHTSTLVPTQVNGIMVGSLWDTGASISLISAALASRLRMQLEYAQIGAVTITGGHLPVIGAVTATLRVGHHCRSQRLFVVTDTELEVVLGTDFLATLPPVTFDYQQGTVRIGGQSFSLVRTSQHSCALSSAIATEELAAVPDLQVSQKRRRRHRRRRNRQSVRHVTSSNVDMSVVGKPEPTLQTAFNHRLPAVQTESLLMASTADVMGAPLSETPAGCIASSSEEEDLPLLYLTSAHHDRTLDGPGRITPSAPGCLHTNPVAMPRPSLTRSVPGVVSDDNAAWRNRQSEVLDVLPGEAYNVSPTASNCLHDNGDIRPRPHPRPRVANTVQLRAQT